MLSDPVKCSPDQTHELNTNVHESKNVISKEKHGIQVYKTQNGVLFVHINMYLNFDSQAGPKQ